MGQFNPFENSVDGNIDTSVYATDISMSIDSKTYIMYTHLKNEDGDVVGKEQKIDLPLETMVVGGSYDDTTKKVILTLKNGNTVDFSVADLVSGLQTEITSTNKLNSDLVDDTNQNNKFVTSAEKTKIANALVEEVYNAGKTIPKGTSFAIDGVTYTVGDGGEIFNNYGNNKVAGNRSHAEGNQTKALGNESHAEGRDTIARGENSHAEGRATKASGDRSHAEGSNTTASGWGSHAEGRGAIASSACQHVQGKFNVEDSNGKYAFIIGNGTDNDNRSNAFAVDWNGKIYVNNSETGVNVSQLQSIINSSNKISADYVDDSNSSNKFVTSAEKTKIANALTEEIYNAGKTVPEGTTYVIDKVTYTVGNNAEIFNDYTSNKAAGNYSHAEGNFTKAIGVRSHAEGSSTTASGEQSHAEGGHTTASGDYSHAEGSITTANGVRSHAEGDGTTASGNTSHAEGSVTKASGTCSHAEGAGTMASGEYSHAEGRYTTASGGYSHAEGNSTKAGSTYQHVQGKYNVEDANDKYAFIIGNGTSTTTRSNAFAIDWNGLIYVNNASTGVNVSQLQPLINSSNKLSADFIDDSSSINKLGLPTIDIDFSKSNIDTIPEDKRFLIQENKPFAFRDTDGGILSEYRFPLSIVAQTTETGGLWGCELQIKSHYYATIYINLATFTYSVQYWNLGTLNIDDSGSPNKFVTVDEKTKIANALTEEVYNAGKQVKTGNNTGEIFNEYSNNKATGNYSHAEGSDNTASGLCSHAEGNGTLASSAYAHSEGGYTIASGFCSHAEGGGTRAKGTSSHAEGQTSTAIGKSSHTEGTYTIASSENQHVQGKYNIEDSNSKYAFIIGNGTADDNRSNAFAVDWEGKIYVNNAATGVDVSTLQSTVTDIQTTIGNINAVLEEVL